MTAANDLQTFIVAVKPDGEDIVIELIRATDWKDAIESHSENPFCGDNGEEIVHAEIGDTIEEAIGNAFDLDTDLQVMRLEVGIDPQGKPQAQLHPVE